MSSGESARLPETPQEVYPRLAPRYSAIGQLRDRHVDLFQRIHTGSIYLVDLVLQGALKRSLDLLDGVLVLVDQWNFSAAGPLLRLQLDSVLRVAYMGTASDPAAVALSILEGRSFRKMRDATGKRLTDARLRELAAPFYPWLSDVYEETSDLVHLSNKHCFLLTESVNDETRTVVFRLGPSGFRQWPEASLDEFLAAFAHATDCLLSLVAQWVERKKQEPPGAP